MNVTCVKFEAFTANKCVNIFSSGQPGHYWVKMTVSEISVSIIRVKDVDLDDGDGGDL
jgi:hypothetical protein